MVKIIFFPHIDTWDTIAFRRQRFHYLGKCRRQIDFIFDRSRTGGVSEALHPLPFEEFWSDRLHLWIRQSQMVLEQSIKFVALNSNWKWAKLSPEHGNSGIRVHFGSPFDPSMTQNVGPGTCMVTKTFFPRIDTWDTIVFRRQRFHYLGKYWKEIDFIFDRSRTGGVSEAFQNLPFEAFWSDRLHLWILKSQMVFEQAIKFVALNSNWKWAKLSPEHGNSGIRVHFGSPFDPSMTQNVSPGTCMVTKTFFPRIDTWDTIVLRRQRFHYLGKYWKEIDFIVL